MEKPLITVAMVSYKRPKLRNEAIKALKRKPGIRFEFLHWNNDKKNYGHDALRFLLKKAKGKYFVVVEDDMIWFQDNWLKNLVEAFEINPPITREAQAKGVKTEWGALATRCLVDKVNNGGMWSEFLDKAVPIHMGKINYLTNLHATAGAIIYRTDVLKKLDGFWNKSKRLNGTLYRTHYLYEVNKYPTALLKDTYIYHACSPYWNELYRDVFKKKQADTQTIEEAFKIYSEKGDFDWTDKRPMKALLDGTFERYARKLWKDTCNG